MPADLLTATLVVAALTRVGLEVAAIVCLVCASFWLIRRA